MTGLIILAAGPSSRLGQPKQKLVLKGKTLLQQAVDTGLLSACKPVIVVLGASAEEIKPDIQTTQVSIYYNGGWGEGIASSIRIGITALQKIAPEVSGAVLMVTDQPFVSAELLNDLINKKDLSGKNIVASSYDSTLGVPVLFDKKFFPDLLLLKGQEGAKHLLMNYREDVESVLFSLGGVDIDTIEDYQQLVSSKE